jgi:hypothetical protein
VTAPGGSQPFKRAPTLGVLTDWLEGEYQSAVVGGIVEAARAAGANLVFFTSCMQRAPFRLGERRNVVYDLARSWPGLSPTTTASTISRSTASATVHGR